MTEKRFLPVWAHSRFSSLARDVALPAGKWWSAENFPPMPYEHCLVSYVHWKARFRFPSTAFIFGDSGGFTLRPTNPKPLRIDPVDVFRWQMATCTVGCILDLPPGLGKTRIWARALESSVAYTKRVLPFYLKARKKGTAFRWWGVVHGNTLAEQEQWWQAIRNVYPFDDEGEGWAVRPEPSVHPFTVAQSMRFAQTHGIRRLHLLSATGRELLATIYALAPLAGLELVTCDSTYATKSSFNRILFAAVKDTPILWDTQMETGAQRHARDYLLTCDCPCCVWMRRRTDETERGQAALRAKDYGGWWGSWMSMHNLLMQLNVTEAQWAEVQAGRGTEMLRNVLEASAALRHQNKRARRWQQVYSRVLGIFNGTDHVQPSDFPSTPMLSGSPTSLLDFVGDGK